MAVFLVPTLVRAGSERYAILCHANLMQLFTPAMVYADKRGKGAFPYSPEGSLASLQLLLDLDQEGFHPKLFVCPGSYHWEPEVRDGRIILVEETCSYEMVPWRVKKKDDGAILMYDKTPCHWGCRNVLLADGSAMLMEESEFQKLLESQRPPVPAKEEKK